MSQKKLTLRWDPKTLQKCRYCQLDALEQKLLADFLLSGEDKALIEVILQHVSNCPECLRTRLISTKYREMKRPIPELEKDIASFAHITTPQIRQAAHEYLFLKYLLEKQQDVKFRNLADLRSEYKKRYSQASLNLVEALIQRTEAKKLGDERKIREAQLDIDRLETRKSYYETKLNEIHDLQLAWIADCHKALPRNPLCMRLRLID